MGIASRPPRKSRLNDFCEYLVKQMKKAGVSVKSGEEATLKLIEDMKPDAVVLATGVVPLVPDIPGINRPNVLLMEQALAETAQVGQNVVVIGGGQVGCETAEFLAAKGKKVIIVEMLDILCSNDSMMHRHFLLYELVRKKASFVSGVKCEEIGENSVVITTRRGKRQVIPADTIVIATGARSNNSLAKQLEGRVSDLRVIGDCLEPRKVVNAVQEGFQAGCKL